MRNSKNKMKNYKKPNNSKKYDKLYIYQQN